MEKKVWLLWLDGWDVAPPLVLSARASWELWNPGYRVVSLCLANLREHLGRDVPDYFRNVASPQALSDAICLELLSSGGVWADASVLCFAPLDSYLPDAMAPSGFWMHRAHRTAQAASWLVASERGSGVASAWRNAFAKLATTTGVDGHKRDALFDALYEASDDFADAWNATPFLSSCVEFDPEDPPYAYAYAGGDDKSAIERALSAKPPPHHVMRRVTVVVARYDEDISWLRSWRRSCVVYNKGPLSNDCPDFPDFPEERALPNVGREGHTYAQHILTHIVLESENDDDDVVVFVQGHVEDHLRMQRNSAGLPAVAPAAWVRELALQAMDFSVSQNSVAYPIPRDFSMPSLPKKVAGSYAEWLEWVTGRPYPHENAIRWYCGACFAATKRALRRVGEERWRKVLASVAHACDPMEGHFLERGWHHLIGGVTPKAPDCGRPAPRPPARIL